MMFSGDSYMFKSIATTQKQKEIVYRETVLMKKMTRILNCLKRDPKAAIFLNKVTEKEAPKYFSIIKRPMDLGTMAKKLRIYRNIDGFKEDLDLIWDNCLEYNKIGDYYRNCAFHCKEIADNLLNIPSMVEPGLPESQQYYSNPMHFSEETFAYVLKYFKDAGFKQVYKRHIYIVVDTLEYFIKKSLKNLEK